MSKAITILSTKTLSAEAVAEGTRLGMALTQINFIRTEKIDSTHWIEQSKHSTDVFVFTSARSVESVLAANIDLSQTTIAALSGATQQALIDAGFKISYTAHHAKALAKEIIQTNPKRITFFCGDKHRTELPDALAQHGITINTVIVYKTILTPSILTEAYDGILFFSPSAVQSFLMNNTIPSDTNLFCIGDTTASAIPDTNTNIIISPVPYPMELIRLAAHHFSEHVKE